MLIIRIFAVTHRERENNVDRAPKEIRVDETEGTTRTNARARSSEVSGFVCIAICNVINGNGRIGRTQRRSPGAAYRRDKSADQAGTRSSAVDEYALRAGMYGSPFTRLPLPRERRIAGDASRTVGSRRLGRPEDREPRDRGFRRSSRLEPVPRTPSISLGKTERAYQTRPTSDGLTTDSILDRRCFARAARFRGICLSLSFVSHATAYPAHRSGSRSPIMRSLLPSPS